jgi:chromosome segregation ATPase
VAKRKYLVLEESKKYAENRAKELSSEVDTLKKDFKDFRTISTNNLIAEQNYVDSLSRIVSTLNTDISSKKDNIEDQNFSFQIEKDRLNKQLSEKDKNIRDLTREVNTLKIQIDDLNKKLEDATSNRKFPFGQVKQLEKKLQTRDSEISELNSKLANEQVKNDSLTEKINKLSTEIQKLTGNENQQKLDSISNE